MIAIDSNIFIYLLENNTEFYDKTRGLFLALNKKHSSICSEITIAEIYSSNNIVTKLYALKHNTVVPITREILMLSGKLRIELGLKTLDSIHLATAIHHKATEFITNDHVLAKKAAKLIPTRTL